MEKISSKKLGKNFIFELKSIRRLIIPVLFLCCWSSRNTIIMSCKRQCILCFSSALRLFVQLLSNCRDCILLIARSYSLHFPSFAVGLFSYVVIYYFRCLNSIVARDKPFFSYFFVTKFINLSSQKKKRKKY